MFFLKRLNNFWGVSYVVYADVHISYSQDIFLEERVKLIHQLSSSI